MDKTYREIWEAARTESKAGIEDGRPWIDWNARPKDEDGARARWCWDCLHSEARTCPRGNDATTEDAEKCVDSAYYRNHSLFKSFFWPANEPLPEKEALPE